MSDPLTDLITDVQDNGIRWVSIVTVLALYRKERRNHLLNKRDAALFHNQRIIMEKLGVGDQWRDGPRLGFQSMDLPNLRQLLIMFTKAMFKKKLSYPRRKRKMIPKNINYVTLVPTLLAASKIVLQGFGIDIPDEHINLTVNVIAGLGTLIGVYLPHTKAAEVAEAYVKIAPEIKTTYKEMYPMIKQAHDDINAFLKDVQRNDGSQAFIDGASFYNDIKAIIEKHKQPLPIAIPDEPLRIIPDVQEQQVSA